MVESKITVNAPDMLLCTGNEIHGAESLMNIGRHKIKLIIFDMDGLMFDTERLAYRAWKEASIKFNYKIGYQIFKKTIGLDIVKTEEIFENHYGSNFPFEKMERKNKTGR